ncbi:SDR family NAD(P)-dependent oxidoreductase [Actinomadura sp. 1N219]|uniref:SDR family NAD(P)-dependent oxidoreductase n=1 Tax=Actinomadura sp. 1N219 TaxID=3375152 RepID=UPI0037AB485E
MAIVTGGCGVLGAAIIERLTARGVAVLAVDITAPATPLPGVAYHRADLLDPDATEDVLQTAETVLGPVSILVQCAGAYGDFPPVHRLATASWDAYLDLHASATFRLTRQVLPGMVARRYGRIVTLASVCSVLGAYREAHYAAAKSAALSLGRTVAAEYAPVGVTSNVVLPGVIRVPRLADVPADVVARGLAAVPAGRFGEPAEVAAAVDFLTGPQSGGVTGAALPVDGGTMLSPFRLQPPTTRKEPFMDGATPGPRAEDATPTRRAAETTVLITGANGGIGRLLVALYARQGYRVAAVDRAFDAPPADGVSRYTCDIAHQDQVERTVREVAVTLGPVSVLINCAAVFGDFRPTHAIDVSTWDDYLTVNSRGPFLLIRAVLPDMVRQRFGRIVNVASVSSVQGGYRQAHYAASKAALIGLSNTVAMEYAAAGITANCVLPGVIENPKLALVPADVIEGARSAIPARRFALPEEVVAAVEFLAREDSGYINGVSLPVDGGTSLLQLRFSRDIRFESLD